MTFTWVRETKEILEKRETSRRKVKKTNPLGIHKNNAGCSKRLQRSRHYMGRAKIQTMASSIPTKGITTKMAKDGNGEAKPFPCGLHSVNPSTHPHTQHLGCFLSSQHPGRPWATKQDVVAHGMREASWDAWGFAPTLNDKYPCVSWFVAWKKWIFVFSIMLCMFIL